MGDYFAMDTSSCPQDVQVPTLSTQQLMEASMQAMLMQLHWRCEARLLGLAQATTCFRYTLTRMHTTHMCGARRLTCSCSLPLLGILR